VTLADQPAARTMRIAFEPAQASDAQALAALRVEAMRESLERVGRFDVERARQRLLTGFSPPHTRHILVDGRRVGFLVVRPEAGGLLLDHLYIRPEHQRDGVGAAVLVEVFAQADRERLAVRVGALKDSPANRFYVRHGFVLAERTEWDNYYVRMPATRD